MGSDQPRGKLVTRFVGKDAQPLQSVKLTSRDLIIDDVRISSRNMQVSSQIKLCDDFVTITNWS